LNGHTLFFAATLISCAGSAGGGLKVVRVLLIAKFLKREIDQLVHLRAAANIGSIGHR
jgi:trk system potassium uptake protein